MRVTNGIHLGSLLFLPVHTANRVQTLKACAWTDVVNTNHELCHPNAEGMRMDGRGQ
jgi:hypothetical protein